jgi:hypothetical protein
MATTKLESRVAALEAEVAELREKLPGADLPWWEKVAGTFEADPVYAAAMELGRQYRHSQQPSVARRKPR